MKQSKMVIWVIIFVFIGLIIFQNQDFFLEHKILHVNLGIVDYESPQVLVAIIFLAFFFFGVIIAYLFSLPERFKTKKMLKKLKAINTSLENELADLKRDVAALKGEPVETKEDPQAKAGETSDNNVAEKRDETAPDTLSAGAAESLSDDSAADPSESPADASDESRLEANDESKKGGFADNSDDGSIEKNT
jgi:uncharacterized membrane protein YciS (DUF1049 family)